VRLDTVLDPELRQVNADPGQVEQVLLNLVVNARDAMPQGGALTITTANLETTSGHIDNGVRLDAGSWVVLSVRDTGCGMAADVVPRIFEPFFTTKAPGRGTGLGLATVYGIVAQSHGQIAFDTGVGTGTTFRIYLPAVIPEGDRADGTAERRRPAPPGGETILLVEDEVAIRRLMQTALQQHGYVVLSAGDAEEALQLATQHDGPIHLLLSDIVMPGASGVDLAQRLVASRPDTKVMHISGFSVAAHVARLKANVTFLQKPFTPETLLRTVRECLSSSPSAGAPPAATP
jgi:CheY-like chemotaxis protein